MKIRNRTKLFARRSAVLFTADAYSTDGHRFTVLSDEKLSAFLELERVTSVAPGAKSKRI